MWAPPVYEYQKFMDPQGTEVWFGRVELLQVGMPLLNVPQRIGPLCTGVCHSLRQAQVEAAEAALKVIQMLRSDLVQQTSPRPMQTVYPTIVPPVSSMTPMTPMNPMASCVGLQYDYMNASLCRQVS
ncbi:Uncharacterized protein OBRU01_16449, partial [Operophtera brumata]